MVLVAGVGLRAVQAERLSGIRIIRKQAGGRQIVYPRRIVRRVKLRLAVRVGSVRIRCEIVVEGYVFLKDYDDVLDRSRGLVLVGFRVRPPAQWRRHGQTEGRRRACQNAKTLRNHSLSSFELIDLNRQDRPGDEPQLLPELAGSICTGEIRYPD